MEQSQFPLINILIRTSCRPRLFARCLQSIQQQTYTNYRIIIACDNDEAFNYIPSDLLTIRVTPNRSYPFFYDRYCNNLKVMVDEGWFMFLDDDDVLASTTSLQQLAASLTGPHEAIICQMLRNGVPKPRDNYIKKGIIAEGKIGLPCLVLHSKHKHLSELDGYKAGDYRYIKAVTDHVKTRFIALPFVTCDRRSRGEMEDNTQFFQNIQ